ncbi:glycosyltransferase family 2 protein [Mesorhizobium sp. CGMCC 1.15528]|uniref:Glycosyltransferase family 2 protein n=1 Tax=Mesorhizobium zhangyense TaxID=1776730 RepID=A0A7C9R7K4_9HYPH|nr:glycosyltransferase family 2 protein [Mesorhizobium zhangyense]NGN40293.1 glycosyltransferase family 2 protein [Mesorhizobium zhangyense]
MTTEALPATPCMVVIPCLNEAAHIEALIDRLTPSVERLDMKIVVADGGSTDGTQAIVQRIAATNPRVTLLPNPKKIQSAAINLAVERFGDEFTSFIRIDAHGDYPADYCDRLIEDADETGADSVVVSMATRGFGAFQKATAIAQNSKLGNGGSPHRQGAKGHWTDHGHHAFMRVKSFRAVGGYDETFSHNEDAELDYRLRAAGYRLWMTDKTFMVYYPRASVPALFRQYLGYGRGRAKNILKHRAMPKIRQMIPLMVFPVVAGTSLAFLSWAAVVPAVLWAAACLGYGVWMALSQRNPYGPLAGFSAMVMHLAWSAGFWLQLLDFRRKEAPAS